MKNEKTSDANPERILALYAECGSLTRVYIDNRFRIISLYLTSLGAIFVGAGWMYNTHKLSNLSWVPFSIGAFLSFLFFYGMNPLRDYFASYQKLAES